MSKYLNIQISKYKLGFTLIELLVAISIFAVVTIVAVGALLNLARAADRSHAIITAIDNLDFAMEQMARTIRVGSAYYCSAGLQPLSNQTRDCPWGQGQSALSFTNQSQQRIVYELDQARGSLDRENLSVVPHKVFSITAPEITIESLVFNVFGSSPTDKQQPRVLIRIKGRTAIAGLRPGDQVSFDLQTSVSQRNPDL